MALHICRGNNQSKWYAQGGYEPIAERLFNSLPVDRFLLEYDTERAGTFEPLRHVPADKMVVLGLVSTKDPTMESQDKLLRRIDEASKYVPVERLALSPNADSLPRQRATCSRKTSSGASWSWWSTQPARCGEAGQ